jgi:integrase
MPRLTDIKIRATRTAAQDILLADGGNLFLRVRPSGSRGWIVRIKRNGKRRVHTLGAWPDVTIKGARAEAARLVAIERGTARVTVAEAVEQFMESQIRPTYRRVANAEVYCRAVTAELGSLAVDAVRPVDVSRMVMDYRRSAPVAAMRLFTFTKNFLAWCIGIGYANFSPAANLKASAFGVKEETRERILTDDEIRAFWHAADLPHRALLRFLLLSGLRIGEAQASQSEWLGADDWLALPPDVMKNGKPHRVYVSSLARQQIEPQAAPVLFRAVSPTAVQAAVHRWQDRHKVESRWTPHDLRRSFASRMGDLNVPIHVIAKCLGHTLAGGGESTSVYVKSEWFAERQEATSLLAKHVAGVVRKPTR